MRFKTSIIHGHQTVESTLTRDQSIRPSAFADAWTARKIFSQVASAAHLRWREWIVCRFPNRFGRSRHGIPVRRRNRIPLIMRR